MKRKAIVLAILAILVLPAAALAQEGGGLPETAVEGLDILTIIIIAQVPLVAGLLGERTVHFIKKIPWLDKRERDKKAIKKLVVQVLAVALPIGIAWASTYLYDVAKLLDQEGWWPIIVLAWPVAHAAWKKLRPTTLPALTRALD